MKSLFNRRRNAPNSDDQLYADGLLDASDPRAAYHIGHKDALARKLLEDYRTQRTPALRFALERLLDFRLCSLIAYHMCRELFGSYGSEYLRDNDDLSAMLGMELLPMPTGRLADTGCNGSLALPVRYRGYGYPLNSPSHVGQLFQVNLCAFAEPATRLAFLDWEHGEFRPIKGLRFVNTEGRWQIYETDRSITDDMTAVFLNERNADVRIEIAHVLPDGSMPLIYRYCNVEADIDFGKQSLR